MINRIPQTECLTNRFSLPERIDYECPNGYSMSKVGDKVFLSFNITSPADKEIHNYGFIFNQGNREDLYMEMARLARDKTTGIDSKTITECAKIINANIGSSHYDPRDNI